ncbi:MFS transporter [Bradyrhizobium sp.]|uniref:MFS transporter n=1 Tax=Bradyrhizobium sp. TaxID=376 RepID=UPI00391C1F94
MAAGGGWTAPATLTAFAVAAAALARFVMVERRAARPLVPVDLFRDLAFAAVNFASFALGFSGYSSLFPFSLFLQQAQGWSAAQAGSGIAPVFVVAATGSLLFGRWAARFGLRRLMIVGYVLLGVAMLGMSSFTEATPYAVIAPLFALLGAGLGLSVPATGAATMAVAPRERSGIASATMNALRQSGMTISISLLGTVLATTATASLTTALMNAKVGNAAELASIAIRRHEMPGGLGIAPDTFHAMLASALARGFSAAATLAGLFALLAAATLAAAALQARRTLPGSAFARKS